MRLASLAPDLVEGLGDAADIEVSGITADSRIVAPGMVFAALKGERHDGAHHAAEAVAKGAVAILAAPDAHIPADAPVLRDPDPRRRLALMAASMAGPQPAVMLAVTGTAGKTSVAVFTQQILAAAGHPSVSIGTLGVDGAVSIPGGLTTPDPVKLHARLAEVKAAGVDHVALEASSHGLEQRRLDGVRLTAAAFTNIGRDHLDYHKTQEAYLAAKMRLFDTLLPAGAPTVVDPDAPGADSVLAIAEHPLTVGRSGKHLRLIKAEPTPYGADLVVEADEGITAVALPLIGAFQVGNALLAAGLAMAAGVPASLALEALADLRGAPGRLDRVGGPTSPPVFVDYAHKPEAVTAALGAVRPSVKGRLIVVIGAGGDRDPGKRPMMGKAAAEGADIVIVTDDNPRTEDPATIRAAVMEGAPGALEVADRREAIFAAVAMMGEGDALVIAGKGHEEGQIVGDKVLPFSDHSCAREALGE